MFFLNFQTIFFFFKFGFFYENLDFFILIVSYHSLCFSLWSSKIFMIITESMLLSSTLVSIMPQILDFFKYLFASYLCHKCGYTCITNASISHWCDTSTSTVPSREHKKNIMKTKTNTKKKTRWQAQCHQENTGMNNIDININIILFIILFSDAKTQADPANVVHVGTFFIFFVNPRIHVKDVFFRCASISSIYTNVHYTKILTYLTDHSLKLANLWSLWVCFLKSYFPQICYFNHLFSEHKKHRALYVLDQMQPDMSAVITSPKLHETRPCSVRSF